MTHAQATRLARWLNQAPKSIRVGGHDIALNISEDTPTSKDNAVLIAGHYVDCDFTITIFVPHIGCTSFAAEVVFHEIIHAVWAERRLPRKASEETVATQFGKAYIAVMRDNPDLMKWIQKGLK